MVRGTSPDPASAYVKRAVRHARRSRRRAALRHAVQEQLALLFSRPLPVEEAGVDPARGKTVRWIVERVDLKSPGSAIAYRQHTVGAVVVSELYASFPRRAGAHEAAEAGVTGRVFRGWRLRRVEAGVDVLRNSVEGIALARHEG